MSHRLFLLGVLALLASCASPTAPVGRAYSERIQHLPPGSQLVDETAPRKSPAGTP